MQRDEAGQDGTVGKALGVLDRVAGFGRPVRFAELLEGSDLPKATLYRLLQTLLRQDMLTLDPETGRYAPGIRLVRLAHAAWSQSSLAPIARPHLDRLAHEVGQTVHLAQLDGAQVLYVDKRGPAAAVRMYSEAGKVGPAYCTGVGKAMLAFLPEPELEAALARQAWHRFTPATITDPAAMRDELAAIRAAGHAFDREEHEPGITCLAMPILAPSGRVLGAVSITGAGLGVEALMQHRGAQARAVADISGDLRDWRFPDQGES
ncbi:IclR family transcriptional regulator [Jannaschia ovalis]|uniref:IclR family transcriptional regulator n=1 Tax=Jannaschia ovalis TaxID=3038773 RepID=A0ABY8LJM2_9RHOB|nr:IclR family transcriptional regulator [Jannaschia sp. GRR-S6-38]WGH80338.1 IclR family transcriptional regulator [Jannaschia sp. GRR-S6-38]